MKTIIIPVSQRGRETETCFVLVQFGSPLKNCLHFGICRVEIVAAAASGGPYATCRATARFEAWEGRGIRISFHKESMKPALRERHFAGNRFAVEDAYTLPAAVASAINMTHFTIEPGVYPVLETREYLQVIFA